MATWNCANTSRSEVASTIAAAASGDIINVPAGSSTWTSGISFSNKTLMIIGSGIGSTVITLTGTAPSGFDTGVSGSIVSGFTFILSGAATMCIMVRGQGFRIYNNRFDNQSSTNSTDGVFCRGDSTTPHPTGVIDHNEFVNTKVDITGNANLFASEIWYEPTTIGDSDQTGVVYVETNTFWRNNGTNDVMDGNYGARYVFRYNTVTNAQVEMHSVQGVNRAGKSWEVYNNTFSCTDSRFAAVWMRAGTGVCYSNTFSGNYTNYLVLDNVRSFTTFSYPPGTGNGGSNWDGNTGSLGYPLRDQIGRGPDLTLYTGTGHSTLPTQASEPAYFWGNSPNNTILIHNTMSTVKPNGSAADIVSGRDYFSGVTLSGYTPYTYPHPLVTGGGGGNGTVAVSLRLSGVPTSVIQGTAASATVEALDSLGAVATSYRGTIHFSSSDGTASLPSNYTFLAADNGVKVFAVSLTLNTTGSQTVTVNDVSNPSMTSSVTTTVVAAPIAGRVMEVTSPSASWNSGDSNSITVGIFDNGHNPITSYSGTVQFFSSDPLAVLPVSYTFSSSSSHTFSSVILSTSGPQTITVIDVANSLTDTVTINVVSTSAGPFDVSYPIDVMEEGWTGQLPALIDAVYIRRLEFTFDPDDFDGTKQFVPEIMVKNPAGSTEYITIVKTSDSSTVATISVTANTTISTLVRGPAIVFASGNAIYSMYASTATMTVDTFRIYPQLTGNTTLKVGEPLVNYTEGTPTNLLQQIDELASTGVVTFTPWSGTYKRTDSDHVATSRRWRLESIMGKSAGHVHAEFGLWNVTLGQAVTATVLTNVDPTQTAEVIWVDFDSDPAWIDGHSYRWYFKETAGGTGTIKMFGARLYTYLTGWTQFTSRARICKGGGANVPLVNGTSRWPAFSNTAFYGRSWTEMSGYMTGGATGTVDPLDAGTGNSGSTGSTISGAQITFSDSQDLYLSADWNTVDGERYIETDTPVTSASSVHVDWVLIPTQWNQTVEPPLPCPPNGTVDIECKTGTVTMVCKTGTIECCIP